MVEKVAPQETSFKVFMVLNDEKLSGGDYAASCPQNFGVCRDNSVSNQTLMKKLFGADYAVE